MDNPTKKQKILNDLQKLLDKGVNKGHFSHAAVGLGNLDTGHFSYVNNKQSKGVLFDLASLSKPLSTAVLIHNLLDELNLDSSIEVSALIKNNKFNLSHKLLSLKVSDLLSHQSGLPSWGCLWINRLKVVDNLWKDRVEHALNHIGRLLDQRAVSQPCYSDIGYILLGMILELHYGKSQDKLFHELIGSKVDGFIGYNPLSEFSASQIVPTSYCTLRGYELIGEVHDENCATLAGVSGHAGIFSSAETFVETLCMLKASRLRKYFKINSDLLKENPASDGLYGMRRNLQGSVSAFLLWPSNGSPWIHRYLIFYMPDNL